VQVVGDLLEVGGARTGWVVAVLARGLYGDLPLPTDRIDVGVANEIHREYGFFGAWREEVLLRCGNPGRVEGQVGDASEVGEEFEVGSAVRSEGALSDEGWWRRGRWGVCGSM
jgi:hypothetical protein